MDSLKLLFTGDVCFKNQHDLDADLAKTILAPLKPIFAEADLRIMNLETPLAEEGVGAPIIKSGPNIIGRPRNVAFLTEAGCDCACLANNHTKDYGEDALFATFDVLNQAKIPYFGAGRNIEEAYEAWRTEKNGIKVSILGICENEFGIADKDTSGTAGFQMERLSDAILREKTVSDFVIVFFHGGCEQNPLPSPMARERYRMIVRLGADALIAGHTHCMQGYEYYDGKPIIYSMGNFWFKWERPSTSWYRGYMTMLTLTKGLKPEIRLIPYTADGDTGTLMPLEGKALDNTLAYIEKLSAVIPDTEELKRLYNGWCVISGLGYIRAMQAKPEYFDPADPPENIAPLKNLLSCEAHNELCRTTLNLVHNKALAGAFPIADEVRALQKQPDLD